MLAHDLLKAGRRAIWSPGHGVHEQRPYCCLPNAGPATGTRPHGGPHVFDGLQDAYGGRLMGHYAEAMAQEAGLTRAEQDAYALESIRRAQHAVDSGLFARGDPGRRAGEGLNTAVDLDETPSLCQPEGVTTEGGFWLAWAGRHHHPRQFFVHFRWGRRAGADPCQHSPCGGLQPWPASSLTAPMRQRPPVSFSPHCGHRIGFEEGGGLLPMWTCLKSMRHLPWSRC